LGLTRWPVPGDGGTCARFISPDMARAMTRDDGSWNSPDIDRRYSRTYEMAGERARVAVLLAELGLLGGFAVLSLAAAALLVSHDGLLVTSGLSKINE